MMFLPRIILSIAVLVSLNFEPCFSSCAPAEYEKDGRCCLMCDAGKHVDLHCSVNATTTCDPCPELTYMDKPSSLMQCFHCSVCDKAKGLRVKKACTPTADIICEPLEGFFCTYQNKNSCGLAVQQSKCDPGQYIKQTGTAFTDNICANCSEGTFSNGSLLACQPHSICEMEGLTEIKAGTSSTDAECEKSTPVALIVGLTVGVLVAIVTAVIYLFRRRKRHLI